MPRIPHIPNHEDLLEIFDAERCANMEWLKVEDVFRCFIKLLSFSSYQYHVMLGLIMSVGGLTEQLVSNYDFLGGNILIVKHSKTFLLWAYDLPPRYLLKVCMASNFLNF